MTHVGCEFKLRSVMRSGNFGSIHAEETGWQLGMWSYSMAMMPTHLV